MACEYFDAVCFGPGKLPGPATGEPAHAGRARCDAVRWRHARREAPAPAVVAGSTRTAFGAVRARDLGGRQDVRAEQRLETRAGVDAGIVGGGAARQVLEVWITER